MAYRKPSGFLLAMALLVLCGQVLAAPFLACRDLHGAPTQEAVSEHCAGLTLAGVEHELKANAMAGLVDQTEKAGQELSLCAFFCQFCAGTPGIAVTMTSNPAPVPSWAAPRPVSSIASQVPGDHFRPPTAA